MFVDQNGHTCFVDQNGITTFVDQNGNLLTCGPIVVFGGFHGKGRIK